MKLLKRPGKMYKDSEQPEVKLISGDLQAKIAQIQEHLSYTDDLKVQKFFINDQSCALVYLDALVDAEIIQSNIIKPMLEANSDDIEQVVTSLEVQRSCNISYIVSAMLTGFCAFVSENAEDVVLMSAAQFVGRSIDEPKSEQVIRGAREGFVESLTTNIYLLRKRIRSPKLKVKYFSLGKLTNTKVAMVYMDNKANSKVIEECEKRISAIQLDYLYSVENIAEMIEEHPLTPFPQVLKTERPDRVVSYLIEGKISIHAEGVPAAIVLPISFFSLYQSSDDYNSRWIIGSFYRFLRFFSFLVTISLPAIYIAIVSYHSEVLPIGILYSVKVSLTYVPFPPLMEALTMQIILELLKEAAIRLPSSIAQTIGIVGGLVIGTAVVEAHLVSHTMIVVIGLTAIASFITPINELGVSLRILGFPMMIAASLFGFFGIAIMIMIIFIHLCKIEMLGVPYFTPFGPFQGKMGFKDIFLRFPIWAFNKQAQNPIPGTPKQQIFKRWKRS